MGPKQEFAVGTKIIFTCKNIPGVRQRIVEGKTGKITHSDPNGQWYRATIDGQDEEGDWSFRSGDMREIIDHSMVEPDFSLDELEYADYILEECHGLLLRNRRSR